MGSTQSRRQRVRITGYSHHERVTVTTQLVVVLYYPSKTMGDVRESLDSARGAKARRDVSGEQLEPLLV